MDSARIKRRIVWAVAAIAYSSGFVRSAETPAPPKPPSPPYLSPEESAKTVQLPPGYRLELVLSEPDIREPVISVFDGNGRLYVAEMRTYMQDADAKDQKAATSRVSLHWSSQRDGTFDRHAVFVDNLLLPRMVPPLKDSVLIQETDTGDVFEYRDTNGDGVQIELPHVAPIAELRLSSVSAPRNATRGYRVELSTDGENWGEPVATGRGLGPIVEIAFAPTKAKWIRITHTQPQFGRGGGDAIPGGGRGGSADWTLDDVQLFQPVANAATASQ